MISYVEIHTDDLQQFHVHLELTLRELLKKFCVKLITTIYVNLHVAI
jgi:hypothetical protein